MANNNFLILSNFHSNEQFDINGFIRANTEYPGKWDITVERIEEYENCIVSVVLVLSTLPEANISFYAVSFFEFQQDKIVLLNKYWSENTPAPQWRQNLKIAKPIR